jgi:hypothetical protein
MDSLEIFYKIAQDNTPPIVSVRYMGAPESCGIANYATGEMTVPRPDSIENLLTYLHECAHFFLHKDDETSPKYLREFEAESWALKKMQAAGLALPDGLVLESKKRIANEIRGAVKRGTQRLDERAFKFALPCFHDFELPDLMALTLDS